MALALRLRCRGWARIVIHLSGSVTLSCDQGVNGALGTQLIGSFKDLIENPMGMLV